MKVNLHKTIHNTGTGGLSKFLMAVKHLHFILIMSKAIIAVFRDSKNSK